MERERATRPGPVEGDGGRIADRGNRPITAEQRRLLVQTYRETGSVAKAMAAAGAKSRSTAYRWIRRAEEDLGGDLAAHSHARHDQQGVPEPLAGEIRQLRRRRGYGRERIAHLLGELHREPVVSPAGVEGVLRRAGLWTPQPQPPAPIAPRVARVPALDAQEIASWVREGIRLDLEEANIDAAVELHRRVWRYLGALQREGRWDWTKSLHSHLGLWLLKGRVWFGHALLHQGDWRTARYYLTTARDRLVALREAGGVARATEERAQRDVDGVALLSGNIWLECLSFLATAVQTRDLPLAETLLRSALWQLEHDPRLVLAERPLYLSNTQRDLAQLIVTKPRATADDLELVDELLSRALALTEEVGNTDMQAATLWMMARRDERRALLARDRPPHRVALLDAMQGHFHESISRVGTAPSSSLTRVLFTVDALKRYARHGMLSGIDRDEIRSAAARMLVYGYGHQARLLLAIPDAASFVGDELDRLLRQAFPPDAAEGTDR